MITAEEINKIEKARMELFQCGTKEEAEAVFVRYSILDIEAKTALLNRCMQVQDAYGIPGGKEVTPEAFYSETLNFFVDGQWRNLI